MSKDLAKLSKAIDAEIVDEKEPGGREVRIGLDPGEREYVWIECPKCHRKLHCSPVDCIKLGAAYGMARERTDNLRRDHPRGDVPLQSIQVIELECGCRLPFLDFPMVWAKHEEV